MDRTEPVDTLAAALALAGDDDQPEATEVTEEELPAGEVETEETGAGEEEAFEAPFNLAEVDEAYREHVERYVKQVQGAYTRKTQELAARRAAVEQVEQFLASVDNEETRDRAIELFLSQLGYDVQLGDDGEVEEEVAPDGTEDESYDEYAARIAALEQRIASREEFEAQQSQAASQAAVMEWVDATLDWYAGSQGLEALPDADREAIITIGRTLPFTEDGMPDVHGAIAQYEAHKARLIQSYVDSKKAPDLDTSGFSASEKPNLSADKDRLALANQIAARHVG